MRHWLFSATLFLCVASAAASPLPEYPFVFTTGTAKSDSPPDVVELSFSLSARHPNANAAVNAVREGTQRVLEILAAAGVKEPDIDASSFNKSEERHWDDDKDVSVSDGFEVRRDFSVTIRDLTKYPDLGKALLDLSGTADFDPTFNRTDKAKIEADLLQRASNDARTRAERVAASFSRTLGPARAISQIPFGEIPHRLGLGDSDRDLSEIVVTGSRRRLEDPDSLLVPATISFSAKVNVVYELQ
jgi:uncharacterized protein YggE